MRLLVEAIDRMLRALVCSWRGHQWFPDDGPREFIPVRNRCLRCAAEDVRLPWGDCLNGHPLAEHYDPLGTEVTLQKCPWPR